MMENSGFLTSAIPSRTEIAQRLLNRGKGNLAVIAGHLVTEFLQLNHAAGRQNFGANGESLADLDVKGTQTGNGATQLPCPLNFQLMRLRSVFSASYSAKPPPTLVS